MKGDWKERIQEVKKLNIKEICFFPTGMDKLQRRTAYRYLEKSGVKRIPLVHIRHDFESWELDYFIEKFKTEMFNIHSQTNGFFKLENDLTEYNKYIYIENTLAVLGDEPAGYAGICLDLAHLENARLTNKLLYKSIIKDLKKFKTGPCHLSAAPVSFLWLRKLLFSCDRHWFTTHRDLDYVVKYKKYFSEVIALELENTIHQQLQAIKYLKQILK